MVKLIATLGTSPGGIFESYTNLINGTYQAEVVEKVPINEVYIIRTSDKAVEFAWKLVKAIFVCCGGKNVTIADIPLSITDITSKDDYLVFKKAVEARINEGDYVDITGGRKAMSVAAAVSAMRRKAKILTTIIPPSEYNRIQKLIEELKSKEEEIERAGKGECNFDFCQLVSKSATTVMLT